MDIQTRYVVLLWSTLVLKYSKNHAKGVEVMLSKIFPLFLCCYMCTKYTSKLAVHTIIDYCTTNPSLEKKLIMIYFSIILENPCYIQSHARLQTKTKTAAKFQKDPGKIVGRVAFTAYPVPICFG